MPSRNVAGYSGQAGASVGMIPGMIGPIGGGGGSPPPPPASGLYYVVKQADQIQSSNATLANDNELKLANIPAGTYAFTAFLDFVEANSTMNARIGFAGASAVEAGGFQFPSGGVPAAQANGSVVGPVTVTLSSVQLRGGILIDGFFTMAAQATLTLQWAQNVSNAGNLTLKAGSWLQILV